MGLRLSSHRMLASGEIGHDGGTIGIDSGVRAPRAACSDLQVISFLALL